MTRQAKTFAFNCQHCAAALLRDGRPALRCDQCGSWIYVPPADARTGSFRLGTTRGSGFRGGGRSRVRLFRFVSVGDFLFGQKEERGGDIVPRAARIEDAVEFGIARAVPIDDAHIVSDGY